MTRSLSRTASAFARTRLLAAAALALALSACEDPGSGPGPHVTVSIDPGDLQMDVGEQRVLTATATNPDGSEVPGVEWSWSTSNPAVAEVSPLGLLTAKGAGEATITADGWGASGTARAVVVLGEPRLLWREWTPRAVNPATDDSATLVVALGGRTPSGAVIARPGGRAPVTLTPQGDGTYRARMAVAEMVAGYQAGTGHNYIGHLRLDGATTGGWIVSTNVRDGGMPSVPVTALAADAQASPHVVNLRWDDPYLGRLVPKPVVRRLFDFFPDAYDFVATIQPVNSPHNRFFARVRNDVEGIGLPPLDVGAEWGSAARLKGLIHFPIDDYFDMADFAANHEIGHQWINFLRQIDVLAPGAPHWPISTLAHGVMGFSLSDGAGGPFPYRLEALGNGDYRVVATPLPNEFNDLEMYLMGLGSIDEVGEHVVFENQNQRTEIRHGGTLRGPVRILRGSDIVAAFGPRKPAYGEAQSEFRIAVIVLSRGRLLTPGEMAFFDHMVARGEGTAEVPFAIGLASGTAKPFRLATHGRGTLVTRLQP